MNGPKVRISNWPTTGMSEEHKPPLPLVFVPLAAVMTPMFAGWCVLFEVSTVVTHILTNGRHPTLGRVLVCTAITVTANAYCFYTARQHRACREACAALVKEGIGQPAINVRQTVIVILVVMAVSALFAWTFFAG